jgi:hypothetical protein
MMTKGEIRFACLLAYKHIYFHIYKEKKKQIKKHYKIYFLNNKIKLNYLSVLIKYVEITCYTHY